MMFNPRAEHEHYAHHFGTLRIAACGIDLREACQSWTSGDDAVYSCVDCYEALTRGIKPKPPASYVWAQGRNFKLPKRPAGCAYCGHDKTEANPKYIEQYNVLLEALVHLNIIHPETRTRLVDPAGEWPENKKNKDWVNRIVERVVRLRVTREDEGAKAIVDSGTYSASEDRFFYRCVCLRSCGVKEDPEGKSL